MHPPIFRPLRRGRVSGMNRFLDVVPSLARSIIVREHGYFGVVEIIAERDFVHHVLLARNVES